MTAGRRLARPLVLLHLVVAAAWSSPLAAQGVADALAAGKAAYLRADFPTAIRTLPAALVAAPTDTAWASGLHMLLDALLIEGDSTGADLWARWGVRAWPAVQPDSITFPPAVTQRLAAAILARAELTSDDTLGATSWEARPDLPAGRGLLRISAGSTPFLVLVEGVGTVLPGESRTLAPGVYRIRAQADGYAPLEFEREVVPALATTVNVRLRRGGPAQRLAPFAAGARAITVRGASLAAGGATTCTVAASGRTLCWGDNRFGQFGLGLADSVAHGPGAVAGRRFAAITVGGAHACGLTRMGAAFCWGLGTSGQLGHGQTTSSAHPVAVAGDVAFITIAAGTAHTCAVSAAGTPFCWGSNRDGELGNRSTSGSAVPVAVAVPPGTTFQSLTAGGSHSCALTLAGAAWCWGANASGQLGTGGTGAPGAPGEVTGGLTFRALAAGRAHVCGITTAGSAFCWGANASGQLGTEMGGVPVPQPATVAGGFTSFTTIAAGDAHTCALTADLATYCWGAGRAGQLGNGQQSDSPRPVLVIGGHDFRSLSLGTAHTCGMDVDGFLWCWGDNSLGQIGSLAGRTSPSALPALTGLRPARPASSPPGALVELFDEEWWTAWATDSTGASRVALDSGALVVSRQATPGLSAAVGIARPVRIPVRRGTALQVDVRVDTSETEAGCGLNCAAWPAVVRLRVKSTDLTESELWLVFGDVGGAGRTLGPVVVVARGGVPRRSWLRGQRLVLTDHLPRADTVLEVAVGGVGAVLAARFDNLALPAPLPARLTVAPRNARLSGATRSRQLTATAVDSAGATLPWVALTWTSSDSSVATVDATGTVAAVRTGTAVIRATAGTLADSARVTVRVPVRRRAPRRP